MPKFIMPLGDKRQEYAVQYRKLDAFTQGYIEAMFWAECHADNPELEDATINDLAPEAWERIKEDCAKFQAANRADLDECLDDFDADEEHLGHDFWLTRNGHGVGYWDRGYGDVGDRLSEACGWRTAFGEVSLYRGDDGRVYLMEG